MKRPRIEVREVLASTNQKTKDLLKSGKVFRPLQNINQQRVQLQ